MGPFAPTPTRRLSSIPQPTGGSGAGQIGPGTTVHLCGTFTGTAGGGMLTARGERRLTAIQLPFILKLALTLPLHTGPQALEPSTSEDGPTLSSMAGRRAVSSRKWRQRRRHLQWSDSKHCQWRPSGQSADQFGNLRPGMQLLRSQEPGNLQHLCPRTERGVQFTGWDTLYPIERHGLAAP